MSTFQFKIFCLKDFVLWKTINILNLSMKSASDIHVSLWMNPKFDDPLNFLSVPAKHQSF